MAPTAPLGQYQFKIRVSGLDVVGCFVSHGLLSFAVGLISSFMFLLFISLGG